MSDSNGSSQVMIVGAGPAGASLAHMLATRGVSVALLERQTDFSREFRGEVLMPSGTAVLEALKLGDAFDSLVTTVPTTFSLFVNGEEVFELPFDLSELEGPGPLILSQPELLEAIVSDAEAKSSSFSFHRGTTVKELLYDAGRVVGVRARTDAGEREFRSDLIVGCDGRASVVRRAPGFEVEREKLPMDIVWCKLPVPESYGDKRPGFFCLGAGHLFVSYVAADGLLQVAWVILKGTYGELRRQGVEAWVGEMAEFAPPILGEHLRRHAEDFSHPFLLDTAADRVRNWSIPGAMVLGDSAHTMSPVGGQGVNIALRDAVVAANHLIPALQSGVTPQELDAVCARIGTERMEEVEFIQRLQAVPPRIILPKTGLAKLVRRVAKTLLRYEWTRNAAGANVEPFFFGVSEVTLKV